LLRDPWFWVGVGYFVLGAVLISAGLSGDWAVPNG
jgi:hypothetical protein